MVSKIAVHKLTNRIKFVMLHFLRRSVLGRLMMDLSNLVNYNSVKMNLPEPMHKQFSSLMDDISSGRLKIPQFQRDFVWEIKKSASLLDSIVKGYPVGTFIFWKTRERLRSVKNIGNLDLPETEKGDYVNFVLDGQ